MMYIESIESALLWFFLIYMLLTAGSYLSLNAIAFNTLLRYMHTKRDDDDESLMTGHEPPITIIIPAYNEEQTIVSSIRSLLQLYYPEYELVIVVDGATDGTLDVLIREFKLEPFPESRNNLLETKPIRQVYKSTVKDNLRVIHKDNGGKADSLNAGINISRYPYFCCVDADSILERFSLLRAIQPFMDEPETIACGGTIRIANGCVVRNGHLVSKGLPTNLLALFQLIEYLRSFLFGRIGWSRLNALLIISGAFGVFRKKAVIDAGGYNSATVGEDMELIVRMHRYHAQKRIPYRISFIPDPICWTEVPESMKIFASQRVRWHRGLSESLWLNRELLFMKHSGKTGFLAFPFFILFEWMSPFIELAGYLFTVYLVATGKLGLEIALIFFLFAMFLSVLLSTTSMLLDEITFRGISKLKYIPVLFACSFLECLGYRQINTYYRIKGTYKWLMGRKQEWGKMTRKGGWQK
jgi:cellulose synthase/poly-beta-1,6-N-acetylglucosamine synthase-like glycosyltransferase